MKIDMYDEIPTTFGKFGPDHITGAIPMHCTVSIDLLIKELVNDLKNNELFRYGAKYSH